MTPTDSAAESLLPTIRAAQALHDARRWTSQEAGLRALLARQPAHAGALRQLGLLAAGRADRDEATLWFRAALAAAPGKGQPHVDLGIALRQQGLGSDAVTHFVQAAELEPGNPGFQLMARLARAGELEAQGQLAQALSAYREAASSHPDSADAWAALAMLQRSLGDQDAAQASFQSALRLAPDRLDLIELFALTLRDLRRYTDAAVVLDHLLRKDATRPEIAGRLMHCKLDAADWTELDRLGRHIESGIEAGTLACEPFVLLACCEDPGLQLRAAREHARARIPDRSSDAPAALAGREGPLRIGYVAGEFRNHAVSVLLTGVLEHHDRSRFEVFAFDTGTSDDSVLRRRIEAALEIVPLRGLGHDEALRAIRSRQVDILVDLNGHSGMARHDLFAARAAPIQLSYLGYPGSTGMPWIDYLIADPALIPPGDEVHFSEQIVFLPDSYQPNDRQRPIEASPASRSALGLPDDAFVFCCMNHVFKILPKVFDVWMRILKRVPGSLLLLYSDQPQTQDNLLREAAQRGVDGARIVFAGPVGPGQHLARLRLCDLFLDTSPYNAHTSGSDALWAGLPVLSCRGRTFASRVGASLLNAVGLPDLVVDSWQAYEDLAVDLANDPDRSKALRRRLAANLRTTALFDVETYTRHLEAAYEQMASRARDGLAPASFSVPRQRA